MRILIADDNKDNRDPLAVWFRHFTDWEVTMAESGEDALFKYSSETGAGRPFDAIVLDIAMPDITGLKVAQIIRQSGDTIPIVFLTAYDKVLNRQASEDVGAVAYLTKPMGLDELQAALEQVLSGGG